MKRAAKKSPALKKPAARRRSARIIECDDDIAAGIRSLRRRCRFMRLVHDAAGTPPLRRGIAGFEGVARIVVGQQLSVASAGAIWGRTQKLASPFDAPGLMRLSDTRLSKAGLSGSKVKTLRALSKAVINDGLELDAPAMVRLSDEAIHESLTSVHGIGPWTADIFLMFCLGRADAWASGDLALQVAAQQAMDLSERPTAAELTEIAEIWRPWRSVAARLLWSYYAVVKAANSGAPV